MRDIIKPILRRCAKPSARNIDGKARFQIAFGAAIASGGKSLDFHADAGGVRKDIQLFDPHPDGANPPVLQTKRRDLFRQRFQQSNVATGNQVPYADGNPLIT